MCLETKRLEQEDSYLLRFESYVVDVRREEGYWVALEASAFYPASGGQAYDKGTLNGVNVVEVKKEKDVVWHNMSGVLGKREAVSGVIDWTRRYRHMQRHTAQHLVSQAFIRLSPAFETRAVSLRSAVMTLDLAGEPAQKNCEAAEVMVNELAYKNLEIKAFQVDEADLSAYSLRRPAKVAGTVRLVQMGDWELSACGGTHLRSTSEALPIKLLRLERIRQGLTRVYLMAGLEALEDYRLKHSVSAELTKDFSVPVPELPQRMNDLKAELAVKTLKLEQTRMRLAETILEGYLDQALTTPHGRVLCLTLPIEDHDLLPFMAQASANHKDLIGLFASRKAKATMLFVRGSEVAADMNELLQVALPHIRGRGGGKPARAQGGGDNIGGIEKALENVLEFLDTYEAL